MFCYEKKLSEIAKQEEFLTLLFDQPRTITDAIVQLTETFSTRSKLDAVSVSQQTDAFHKPQPKVAWQVEIVRQPLALLKVERFQSFRNGRHDRTESFPVVRSHFVC